MDLWRCAIVRQSPDEILRDGIDRSLLAWLPESPHGQFLADPFGLWRDGVLHVFAEAFDYRERIGRIDLLRFTVDCEPIDRQTVLREPFHLSYPFVFEAEGEVWMLPEAFKSGTLTLYRARRFPDLWEPAADIPLDGPAIDATPFFHRDRWWLFYSPSQPKAARRSRLHLAHAATPTGPWTLHPGNPVLTDIAGARPGGTPFLRDGRIVLPVQDCAPTYGHAIRALEITELDETRFAAAHTDHLPPPFWMAPYVDGLHTLSAAGSVTLIDVKRMDASLRGKYARLSGIIGHWRRQRR